MSIGKAAQKVGVRTSALRFYEDAGIVPHVPRVNGRRIYSDDAVALLQVVKFAQSVGFTLQQIRQFSCGFEGRAHLVARWRPLALEKVKELDAVIAKARQMKSAIESGLRCGCIRLEDCLPKDAAAAPSKRRSRA